MTTKEKLLALLEDSKGTFFSGEEIARTLQVSRAAVWKAVNALREDGYTIDDVLVHDAHCESNFLHQQLAMMDGHDLPLAIGVIREVDAPNYDTAVAEQVAEVKAKKGFTCLHDMILSGDTWEVK